VFGIDPEGRIRAILYHLLSIGRNMDEILRLPIVLQTADEFQVATPANWRPGEDATVPPPGSCGAARERVNNSGPNVKCVDWLLWLKKGPDVGAGRSGKA